MNVLIPELFIQTLRQRPHRELCSSKSTSHRATSEACRCASKKKRSSFPALCLNLILFEGQNRLFGESEGTPNELGRFSQILLCDIQEFLEHFLRGIPKTDSDLVCRGWESLANGCPGRDDGIS